MDRATATELYANAASHGSTGSVVLAAAFSTEIFGRRLVRLKYACEADEYQDALQFLRWMALGKNRRWQADVRRVQKLAKQVLDYWITDCCPTCLGRGAMQVVGTPHLEDQCCPACEGSGVRQIGLLREPEWGPRTNELLAELNDAVKKFGGKTAAVLFAKE